MADQDRPRSRHAEALGVLVEERYDRLVRFAGSRLRTRGVPKSSADPEDVVQNALKSVLSYSEPIGNMKAFVYTCIGREMAQAAQRHAAGRGYASLDADVRLADEPVVNPFAETELRHVIDEAMCDLPLQQRKVMLLTREMGFTQAEAARVLGAAPGTVGVHAHRAIRALRVTLVGLGSALVALVTWVASVGVREVSPAAGIATPVGAVTLGLTGTIGILMSVLAGLLAWTTGAGGLRVSEVLRALAKGAVPERPIANTSASSSSPAWDPGSGRWSAGPGADAPPQ
ncbi:sigma-70 family RNA polymerase sigma factor [Streptomyces sp. NPDC048200]|uniref:sigma-70 family RNA polymerase sigma factor n=1 Tax=Streptomyces sp. NPDC048200 TaxID=3365512 RepID=UPI0037128DAA